MGRDPQGAMGQKKLCPHKHPSLLHSYTKLSSCHKQWQGWQWDSHICQQHPATGHCCTISPGPRRCQECASTSTLPACPAEPSPSTMTPDSLSASPKQSQPSPWEAILAEGICPGPTVGKEAEPCTTAKGGPTVAHGHHIHQTKGTATLGWPRDPHVPLQQCFTGPKSQLSFDSRPCLD